MATVLSYLWIENHFFRFRTIWKRGLFWAPAILVIVYSCYLSLQRNFIPNNPVLEDVWFVMMSLFAIPQFVFALCSGCGRILKRLLHIRYNWGNAVGIVLAIASVFCTIFGFTKGFRELEVKHLTLYVPDLPKSFDGYRIVQFSDIHLGSYYGWRADLPQRDIDTINSYKPDMICFTGDLQNVQPSELPPYREILSSLKAKDGVFSVLGNHDYSYYVDADSDERVKIEQEVRRFERSLGWRLLNNEHAVIRRQNDSIFIVGTENYDKPKHTNVAKALYGIRKGNFVLMLQHIPTQWRETWPSVINEKYGSKDTVLVAPQLTLSGHTHAGQISIGGLRPSMFAAFDYGLYEHEGCQLYTTAGLGGTIPIRLGATAEIVVITLRSQNHS